MPDAETHHVTAGERAGAPESIGRALAEGYDRLVVVARGILRDEDEARDAAQDACVSALRASGGFAHRSQASTWLHRIVVNAALMRRRQQRRHRADPVEPVAMPSLPHGPVVPSSEEVVASEQLRTAVRGAIASLPGRHRAVLELRELQELDTAEAASALGLTPGAARIRLHRARRALRDALSPVGWQAAHA